MSAQLALFELPIKPAREENCLGISGLTYCSHFLSPDEQEAILVEVGCRPWREDLKRRVQHYGYKYDYKSRAIDRSMYVGPLPSFAVAMGERLVVEGLIDELPDQMIVNEYKPGQGISAHVDCEPCFKDSIVTVSLGWEYEMDFLRGSEKRSKMLEVGSALSLRGEARYEWQHCIMARKSDHGRPRDRRVSLTFRNVILDR